MFRPDRRTLLRTAVLTAPALASVAKTPAAAAERGIGDALTTISNARIFDGQWLLEADSVVLRGSLIEEVGKGLRERGTVIDAKGGMLLPGLIDAHTHIAGDVESLKLALRFGVTTELEMMGWWEPRHRTAALAEEAAADFRTALLGVTAPDSYPSQADVPFPVPPVSNAADARALVRRMVAAGADYIKIVIEDGHFIGRSGLRSLDEGSARAAVEAAHALGKLTVVHVLSSEAADRALRAGADGIVHCFLDRHDPTLPQRFAASRTFVAPTIVMAASIMGQTDKAFAQDPRVKPKLSQRWFNTLQAELGLHREGKLDDVLASVRAMHAAGVDVLASTDSSLAIPQLGGVAHGASVHRELQYFVAAGFSPVEALRSATSVTARCFDLRDRGRIAPGLRADMLLVRGDPTARISDTLSIERVWKRGLLVWYPQGRPHSQQHGFAGRHDEIS